MNIISLKMRTGLINLDADAIGHAEYYRLDSLVPGLLRVWPYADSAPIDIERTQDPQAFDTLVSILDARVAIADNLVSSNEIDLEPYGYDKPLGSINGRNAVEKLYIAPGRLGEVREIHDGRGDIFIVAPGLPYVKTTPSKSHYGRVHVTSESLSAAIDFLEHDAKKLGKALKLQGFATIETQGQEFHVNRRVLAAVCSYSTNGRHIVELLFEHKTHRLEFKTITAARNAALKLAADLKLEVLVQTGDYIAVNPKNLRVIALGQDEFGGRVAYDCLYLATSITHKLHLRPEEVAFVQAAIKAIDDYVIVNATGKIVAHRNNLVAINRRAICGLVVRKRRLHLLDVTRQAISNLELPLGVEVTPKSIAALGFKQRHVVRSEGDLLALDMSLVGAVKFEPRGDLVFVTITAGHGAGAGINLSKNAAASFAQALKLTYCLPLFESARQVLFLRGPIGARSPEFGSYQITLTSGGVVECNRTIFDHVRAYLEQNHSSARPMNESDFQAA